jgi:hypothetical protein
MTVKDYGQLAVIEKALRGQPLSVAERRVAAYLAQFAHAEKDRALSLALIG